MSTQDGLLVLGNFSFPFIEKSGKQMKENIERWGDQDIMSKVWVCHIPIFDKPCSVCHPCELKIETGMKFLMTPKAIKRYKKRNMEPYKTIYAIDKRVFRSITKFSKIIDYSNEG